MSSDQRSAVLRLLPPDESDVTPNALPDADKAPPDLRSDVSVVRDWPDRMALLVGDANQPQILASLHKYGFSAAWAPSYHAEQFASAGPFPFVIFSEDSLADDGAVDRMNALHRFFPSARRLLAYPTGNRDPQVMLRGLRAGVHDVFDPHEMTSVDEAVLTGLRSVGLHRERVLAIGAHPDDVEIGCGGTLLDHRLRDDRITVLTLSRGAVGGDQQHRYEEALTTAEAIGAQLLFGDLPDTQVDEGIATIRLIEDVVRAVNPTVVYVHSKHDHHQDHRAVSTATASATRGVRRVFAYQSPSATNEFRPTSFVPIDNVLRRKVEVLLMFDSQHGRSYLEPELVVAGSRYWARHLGASARYAEPFEVIRSVGDLRQSETTPAAFANTQPGLGFGVPIGLPSARADVLPAAALEALRT